jgi:hypothetical protein
VCFFGSGTGNQEQQKKKNGIFHGDIWFKKMPTLPEQRGQGPITIEWLRESGN